MAPPKLLISRLAGAGRPGVVRRATSLLVEQDGSNTARLERTSSRLASRGRLVGWLWAVVGMFRSFVSAVPLAVATCAQWLSKP